MAKKGTAAGDWLYRARVEDERLGVWRLVWALDGECPFCKRSGTHVYEGKGLPDKADVLMMLVAACPDCALAFMESEKKKKRTRKRG